MEYDDSSHFENSSEAQKLDRSITVENKIKPTPNFISIYENDSSMCYYDPTQDKEIEALLR